jgi:hypothetical protein
MNMNGEARKEVPFMAVLAGDASDSQPQHSKSGSQIKAFYQ